MPYINFTSTSKTWTNFNTGASVAVGTKVTIQNIGSGSIYIQTSSSSPSATAGYVLQEHEFYTAKAGGETIWLLTPDSDNINVYYTLGDNGNYLDERVYTGLKALTVQSFSESNSKNGTQFNTQARLVSVAAGGTLDLLITTGSKPVLTKGLLVQFTGTQIETTLYKGVTASGGNTIPTYSLNTDTFPSMQAVVKANTPTAFTITVAGTQVSPNEFFYGIADQGNKATPSLIAGGTERVLAPNTTYLRRIWNRGASACIIDFEATLYEGELSSQN